MAATAMKGDCFKSILTPAHVSKKLGTKTGCHDANLWTCLAFQHVAVARQNQASGQQLLAVDRAVTLWQAASASLVRLAGKMG